MDAEYWEIALHQALHQIEVECEENNRKSEKCKINRADGYFTLLDCDDNELLRYDLIESTNSPLITSKGKTNKRRRQGVVHKDPSIDRCRHRKLGVAERNETEREVVYRTLRNFIKLNRLHDYNMF